MYVGLDFIRGLITLPVGALPGRCLRPGFCERFMLACPSYAHVAIVRASRLPCHPQHPLCLVFGSFFAKMPCRLTALSLVGSVQCPRQERKIETTREVPAQGDCQRVIFAAGNRSLVSWALFYSSRRLQRCLCPSPSMLARVGSFRARTGLHAWETCLLMARSIPPSAPSARLTSA